MMKHCTKSTSFSTPTPSPSLPTTQKKTARATWEHSGAITVKEMEGGGGAVKKKTRKEWKLPCYVRHMCICHMTLNVNSRGPVTLKSAAVVKFWSLNKSRRQHKERPHRWIYGCRSGLRLCHPAVASCTRQRTHWCLLRPYLRFSNKELWDICGLLGSISPSAGPCSFQDR